MPPVPPPVIVARGPEVEVDWKVGPGRVILLDDDRPFSLTALFQNETERMLAASKVRENPVPFADRFAFWQRVKARREEKRAQREREDQPFEEWIRGIVPEKVDGNQIAAGTVTTEHLRAGRITWDRERPVNPHMRRVHIGIDPGNPDGFFITEGEGDSMRALSYAMGYDRNPAIISSARRPLTRDMVEAKIINSVVDVDEVFWDIATMIDAHRNGATALDDIRTAEFLGTGDDPVWEELSTTKWDPTKERGPREIDYVRRLAKQS